MDKHVIREAVPDDLSGLCERAEQMYGELKKYGLPFEVNKIRLREILDARIRSKTAVAYVLGRPEIAGFVIAALAKFDGRYVPEHGAVIGKISDLYVAPELRKLGYARALYETAEARLRALGVSLVELDVLISNAPAERFWRRCGFEPLTRVMIKKL